MSGTKPRVLVVDDEPALLQVTALLLRTWGYDVTLAEDGDRGPELVEHNAYDVILSDINMPGTDGIGLLRAVRTRDLDVPVILMTGGPTVETAMTAVELGALRYLPKPVPPETLKRVTEHALRFHRIARARREAAAVLGDANRLVGDIAGLEAAFDRALPAVWMAFQPIVRGPGAVLFGFEGLVRSTEPMLPHPGALFDAAERLKRLPDLGRIIRRLVAEAVADAPNGSRILVNLHPEDLQDEDLYDAQAPLSAHAARVVLELTERASLDGIGDVRGRIARLRALGYRVAVDDLGSGYAGLNSFAVLEPEVVKLDMVLVRDADRLPTKQKVISSMISLCRDLGMDVICEGVETAAEPDVLLSLGADLLQGYYFAKPGRGFPEVRQG
jgi:EAL domain-containing protein (putative c-di-GMP-specific phosphodiesterase class I)